MTRAALLLSSLFVAACTVGDIPRSGGNVDAATGTDSGSNGGIDSPINANGCVDRLAPPELQAHLHAAGNVTHAGEGCIVSGCHLNNTGGGPGFQFAGTIYKPGPGKIPSVGANIQVKSAAGVIATGVTDDAGNFNILAGTLNMAFPATVAVTACPTKTAMTATLAQGGGNCTSAACHAGAAAGGTLPVTLADQ